ncbi:MAG: insulinase family protein [Alphaproteobacteria bacterium]|nr:insulinase family protein [Alphaproteobacteria bacterium]
MTRFIIGLLFLLMLTPAQAVIQPKVIRTPGGISLWYLYDKNTSVISLSFLFNGGARCDPEGKEGLAFITSGMFGSGTKDKEPKIFDAYKQDYGIQLGFFADSDKFNGKLAMLVEHKDIAFQALIETLSTPRLQQDVFKIIINNLKTSLANKETDPGSLAMRAIQTVLFQGHPYANQVEGTLKSIDNITLRDIEGYVQNNLTQDRLFIAVVGNIEEKELAEYIDKSFGLLPKKAKGKAGYRMSPKHTDSMEVIDMSIPQSIIYFSLPGLNFDDPDFMKMALLMHIMGDHSSSRLYNEVREKRSLAYAVSASHVWRQDAGFIIGMVGTTKENADQSIDVLRNEWIRLKKDGITQEELDGAKAFMKNTYPLKFNSSEAISEILLGFQFAGRPIDYFQKREKILSSVSLKEMNKFIQDKIQPEKLTFAVVGRPDKNTEK